MLNITIPETENGSRLDRCIRRLLGHINQSLLEKFLRSGMILLDKKKAKSSMKVSFGQVLNYSQKINFEKNDQIKITNEKNKTYYKNFSNHLKDLPPKNQRCPHQEPFQY